VLVDIILIALVGMIAGLVSIPFGFTLTSSPTVVYLGNALGSLFAVLILIYLSKSVISRYLEKKLDKEKIEGVTRFVNKHGVRLFGIVCPFFPGVTISVPAAIALKLDLKKFERWMYVGIFVVSAGYVFSYWAAFVRK
jgi:formate/nitrite transporter FocA (FNT family)